MQATQIASEPTGSEPIFNLALEHMHRNHFAAAMRTLAEALKASPDNPQVLSTFGLCLARQGKDYETALKLCRRALNQVPYDTTLQLNLGKVYRLKGENATAYSILRTAWMEDMHHPAAARELHRMGIRRRPVIAFLPRSHWCNRYLGKLRSWVERASGRSVRQPARHG